MPDFAFEESAARIWGPQLAGIDEAGRGPWAGPVVAAAVVLDRARLPACLGRDLDDSKALGRETRLRLHDALMAAPGIQIGLGRAEVDEIDRLNILRATLLAMERAVTALAFRPHGALVDGNRAPALACPVRTIVRGDALSLSVAAASIVAKVTRDRLMAELARVHPGYGWERNAGYGTPEHRAALARLGVAPPHRRSFAPIRKMLGGG